MKRIVKITGTVLVTVLLAIQFIPRDHNEKGTKPVNDIAQVISVPENVGAILKKSCYDCHSNNTDYPWYAKLQPFRLMLDRHIRGGKAELNFNEFGTYSSRKQRSRLRAIDESLEEGSMPLSSYTFIHKNAILSKEDKATLMNWVKMAGDSLLLKN
ncbi:heme-binding domain-containing protein [Mucilaginibacter gossypii]|uniref:Haem-binding domain-containing protein n=1 Tax=Mucilaginibacter gossypii TaxID=551996 RepID=A0A1G7RND7_9SPHI|nr:heme-binding domain-containing protein [Mucilaginibacter gossypii]SDG12318.1 Haem-binding domain-containing protein [Mucilaginibacter gossypii]